MEIQVTEQGRPGGIPVGLKIHTEFEMRGIYYIYCLKIKYIGVAEVQIISTTKNIL